MKSEIVTAVIVAYWPERFRNLREIVTDLQAGTRPPDSIMIFNNNPDVSFDERIPGAAVINSGRNFTSRSKYAAALLEPSDYYLLLDDDISVRSQCLEEMMANAFPGCAFTDWGIEMTANFITAGIQYTGPTVTEPTPVDAFVGIMQFVSFDAIINLLKAESKIRLPNLPDYRSIGEDLLMGMANEHAYVLPLVDEQQVRSLDGGSKAMQHDPYYGIVREIFVYEAWLILGHEAFEGDYPKDDGHLAYYTEYLKTGREAE